MPEKSWLIVCDQSLGKASVHSGQSLKFLEMASISKSDITALHAHVHVVGPVPPNHNATSASAQPNLQPVVPVQQNLQSIILPVLQNSETVFPDQQIPQPLVKVPQSQQPILPLVQNLQSVF